MPFVIFRRFLRKYGSSSKVQTICFYTKWTGIFQKKKDRCRSDLVLKDGKSSLFVGIPFPNCIFLGKVKERAGMMGKMRSLQSPILSGRSPVDTGPDYGRKIAIFISG